MSKKFEDFLKARDARAEQNESIRKKRAEFNAAQSRSAVDRKYESFINSLRPDERQDLFTSSDERNSEMREWISSVMSQDRYAELESKARNTYIPAQFGQQMLNNQRMRAYQEKYQGTYVPASLAQDSIHRSGAGSDYNAYSDAMLRGEYLRGTDTGVMQKELDALNKELDESKKYYDGAKRSLGIVGRTKGEDDPLYQGYAKQISDYEAKQARAGELKKDIYDAENQQKYSEFEAMRQNRDFGEKSVASGSMAPDFELFDPSTWGGGDDKYDFINDINGYRKKLSGASPKDFAGYQSAYGAMSDDEVSLYNYVYAKQGKDAADKYLSLIEEELNQREGQRLANLVEGKPIAEILSMGASGLDSWVSGTKQNFSERQLPTTSMQYASELMRRDLEKHGGIANTAGNIAYSVGNMAPSILVSSLLGGAGAPKAAAQIAGAATMGTGARGNAYANALREGYSYREAGNYATLIGASEAALQYLLGGISKLGGKLSGNLLSKTVRNIDNAALRIAVKLGSNMLSEGSEEYLQSILEPVYRNLCFDENNEFKLVTEDAAYSFLLGALTSGIMDGGSTISEGIRDAKGGRSILQGGAYDSLLGNALALGENSDAAKLARMLKDGKAHANNSNVGELLSTYAQEGGDISALMSPSPASSAEEDPLRRAAYEVAEKKLQGNTQSAEEFSMPSKAQIQPVERVPANEASSNASNAIAMPDTAATASDTANAKRAEIGPASEIASKLSSAFSASPELNVYADENGSINIDRNGKSYAKMDEREARAMASSYDGSVNAIDYASGFHAAYSYAARGIELSQIKDNSISVRDLTDAQLYAAYAAGRNVYFKENAPAESTLSARRAAALSPDSTEFQPGVNRIMDTKLSKKQESQIRVLDALGRKYGVEIILDDALYHENGGKQGQHSGDNAFYNPNTKRIHINQNALGEAYLAVGMHELTHYIKDNNTKAYDTLEAFILSALEERGENVRALVDYQMEHNGYSEDVAREEVVANTIPAILNDESYVKKLVEADRTLAERIRDFLREFIDTIKETLHTLEGEASWKQMQSIRQDTELLSAIADMFDAALGETSSERGKAKEGVMLSTRERAGFARDRYYDRQIQRWDDLTDGARIKVGEVKLGSALNAVGLHDTGMYFDVGKIKKVMREHGDHLTENIMQQIPDLLSNPIVITQYSENTISVYGDLFVGNTPVVVGVVMNRGANGQTLINKIRTIHARKDFASQITDHNVLYLNEDKKRTRSWFQVCGIHVPLDGNKFGLIRSIRQFGENSNPRFSLKDASPVDVSALQQENEKLAQSLDVALDQTKLTHGHRVKAGLLGTLAGKTVRDYKSEYSASTLKENLVRIFEFLSSSKNPNMNEVHELGVGLMKAVLEKSNRFDSDGYNAYSKERDYLRNTGIAFSDTQKKEAAALFDTFGEYRSSMFGSVKITTDGVPLDTAWQELSEMNSELFPPDTNASNMPRALMIAYEALKRDNFYVNDFGYDLDSAAADAWSNLLEAYYKSQTFDSGKDKIADLNQKMRDLRNAARKEAKAVEREIIRNAEGHAKEIEKRDRRETALRDMILLERVRKRINPNGGTLNPTQIASLDISEFSSTPKLDSIDASSERGGKSKFFESADKSQNVSEETRELIQNDDDVKYYANITNSDTLDEANNRLNSLGASETQRWQAMDPGSATATDVAEGFILLKRYQDAGDYESAVTVIKKLRQMGSRAGQTTQAFSIMGRLTPEAMNMYAQKELDDLRAELVKRFGEKWVDDRSDMFQLTPDEAENIKVLIEQASLLPDGRDKNVILARISSMLEAKIPTNAGKIVKALARNFMLLNTKTMIRNVLGNAIMMPAYIAQDFIGSGIDRALSRSTGIRTTGNTLPSKSALKAAKKGLFESYDDFRLNINTRQIDNDRFEIGSGNAFRKYSMERIKAAHAIKRPAMLLSNALNMMDRITGFLLDAGDRPFFEYHFTNALNNQLRLNNAAEPTSEMIEVATAEALMRTWQDDNSVTKAASTVRNMLNPKQSNGFGIGTLLIPFTKTPANLVKALADYSPVGLVNALARKSRAYAYAVKKGTVTVEMQKRFVDALSKGITGTLIMAIAASLAARGILTGGDDDEDRDLAAFKKNILGIAPYSAVIDGKSYSYDWAQPVGGLAAISADLVQNIKSGKEAVKGFSIGSDDAENRKLSGNVGSVANAILNALSAGGNVIFEQSFLSGIKNLFSEDGVVNGLSNALLNSTTQFIPTALGQIAQISDPYARTYYETGNLLGTTSNRLKAKIPGIRNELAAVVDVMGNDVLAIGGLNVFFNPANVYPENATAAALEIYRVYQETGALSAIPRVAGYSMEYDNVKYEFTSHERSQYQRTMGKTNTGIVEDLLKSKAYASLDDAEKAAVLSNVTTYANAIAKEEFLSSKNVTYDFGPLSWVEKARNGKKVALNVDDYIVAKTVVRDIDSGLKDADGDTIKNSKGLLIMEAVYAVPGLCTLPDKQRLYLFESLGVGKDVRHWNKSLVEQELAKMR